MAYQEERGRKHIVVDAPTGRREEINAEVVRYPDRSGVSGTALAAIVVGVIALAAIIVLFVMNREQQQTANNTQPAPTTIVQQPAQQPPIVVQQPATVTQPAPVIVNNPPSGATTKTGATDDATVQAAIDKKLNDDPTFSQLAISAVVLDGKVTLTGSVKTEAQKAEIERAIMRVKGVKSVDNQLTIG